MEFGALVELIDRVRSVAHGRRVLIFGSASMFASFHDVSPIQLGVDVTRDADFFLDPDDSSVRAELESVLGEDNEYHLLSGYYGDFIDLRMADAFPQGWKDRLVPMPGFDNVFALEPVDMCVTKIAATANSRLSRRMGRGGVDRGMKDIKTIVLLLKGQLVDRTVLEQRLHDMDYEPAMTVECGNVLREILDLINEPNSA